MKHPNIPFLRSVGMMIGSIMGAGIFGLPFAFAQSGFALGLLELMVVACLLTILQLMFAEIVIQTPGRHRLVSYVGMYIGKFWRWVAIIAMSLSVWGAMIAYLIVGGQFLHILLSPIFGGESFIYSLIVGTISSALIYGGLRFASKIEVIIIAALLFLFSFIILSSVPHIDFQNFTDIHFDKMFVPYGVILFSMAGIGIVPELKDILGRKYKRLMGPTIFSGMIVLALLYTLFAFAVVGVTGAETSQTAFEGLIPHLGEGFRIISTLLGSLTLTSIYMVIGIQLLNTFKFDFNFGHKTSWAIVCVVPILMFILGLREFINVIGFVGVMFGGTVGVLIAVSYWKMRKSPICKEHRCLNFPAPLTWAIVGLFIGGMIMQIVTLFT
jgi:tyrosine-specific transport protein